MMWKACGRVYVAASGTPVNAASKLSNKALPCQTIFFQTKAINTGMIYLLDSPTGNRDDHILATIPAPTTVAGVGIFLPWASVTIPNERNALNVNQIWIDVDNSGESCQVSALGAFSPSFGNRT